MTEPFHDVTPDPHYHFVPSPHIWPVSMSPANITVTPLAQRFLSNDGQLEVDISAGTVTDAQIHAAGGTIHLNMTQVLPGAGGTNDAHISFGTYAFQFLDASGSQLSHLVLNHPLVLRYHLLPSQETLLVRGQVVYVIVRAGAVSTLLAGLPAPKNASLTPSAISTASRMLLASTDHTGLTWSVSTNLTISKKDTFAQTPNTISFNTQAPQATWNDPGSSQVDLNSGSLTYTYPLDLPPGPGGFVPSLPLTYSSGGVSQNHDLQSAAPWVGEGWNISLGSISWSQENVTPGSTNKIENVWTINDSTGISGQLIPPDLNASTNLPVVPSPLPNPYVWHTAPESHAKVDEIMFGSYPCWRVFLPTGVIENFGCSDDSRQTYIDSGGHTVVWRWDLDLMIDRYGNQIQVTYQHHTNSDGSIRDAVLSTVEYDDPTCLNTVDRCTTWNPAVKIVFDASRIVTHLTNSTCQGWPGNNYYRCDDPVDLSGSGGLPVPKVVNSEALNDIKVEVQRGFVPVAQLQVGMHVLRADGSVGTLTRIQAVAATALMYNLEITNDHTFAVGGGQWIVHNSCIF